MKTFILTRLFCPPPLHELKKIRVAFHHFFLRVYKSISPSVKVWHHQFDFYRCYGNKNGLPNRLKKRKVTILEQRGTCIKRLFWPPYEVKKKIKVALHKFLLISLLEQSVKVWYWFYFYGCYSNKNGRQNRLKIGKWPFWNKFETFNRGINIEHKQIPKKYFNRWWELIPHTIY